MRAEARGMRAEAFCAKCGSRRFINLPQRCRGSLEHNIRKALSFHISQIHPSMGDRPRSLLADESMLSLRFVTNCPEHKCEARRSAETVSGVRQAIMRHGSAKHPGLGVRERSLLADASVGEFDWAGRELWSNQMRQ